MQKNTARKRDGCAILEKVVREDLTRKMIFEQRLE